MAQTFISSTKKVDTGRSLILRTDGKHHPRNFNLIWSWLLMTSIWTCRSSVYRFTCLDLDLPFGSTVTMVLYLPSTAGLSSVALLKPATGKQSDSTAVVVATDLQPRQGSGWSRDSQSRSAQLPPVSSRASLEVLELCFDLFT